MQAARYWLPRAIGLLSFLWFAVAAAPGFYWLDSAELSAGGIGLGSPHPSGFPLYMMLTKAASLAPLGELSFRVNLLSALCGAYAAGGVARLVLVLGKEDWATVVGAVCAAGVLCFSLLFARQATIAEIYAPTAALIVLTLTLFERVASGGNAGVGLSLAWVAGLGVALHPEYRLLMGLPIVVLLGLRVYRGARWPLLAPFMALFAALATYLYLPIRSATGRIAAIDWGHPNTLGRTWDHATGARVKEHFAERMMSTTSEVVNHDVLTFVGQILDHMGPVAVLAGLIGIVVLLNERRTRWVGVAVGTVVALDFLYATWINPMGLVELKNGVPMVMALALCAGVAVAALARSAGRAAPFVGGVVALVIMVPPALSSMTSLTLVGDLPRAYAEAAVHRSPPRALLLSQGESLTAGASFVQVVEGARPDVGTLAIPMLADAEKVADLLRTGTQNNSDADSQTQPWAAAIVASGRPALWQSGAISPPPGMGLVQGAVVARLVPGEQSGLPTPEALAVLGALYSGPEARDPSARWVLASSLTSLGISALGHGDASLAEDHLRTALKLRPGHALALVSLGDVYSRRKQPERAAEVTEMALENQPNHPQALVNAARLRLALGDLERAAAHAERALAVAPKEAMSWTVAGLVDIQAGNLDRARERLESALAIVPGDREAGQALSALGLAQ